MKRLHMTVKAEGHDNPIYDLGTFDINDTFAASITQHATMAAQLQAAMRELELLSGDRKAIVDATSAKDAEIARLTAEVATLRQRCGRLVELYDATLDTLSDEASRYDLLRRDRAHAECVKHNDLTQGGSYGL